MATALGGVRVLDLTHGPVGGICSMILADFGAQVLKVNRPQKHHLNQLAAAPMWGRGKQQITLDLNQPDQRLELDELCAAADVLIINWRNRALQRHQLDYAQLAEKFPHLVVCQIAGFGHTGPMAHLPGYEHLVAAYSGRMNTFAGITDRSGPVFSALQVGVHACAQSATSGILAALLQQQSTGLGTLVRASMLQGMLPYEQGAMLARQFAQSLPEQFPPAIPLTEEPPLPSLYYHPAQAGDGSWMQFGNLLPHLFDNFLLVTELMDVLADPAFNPSQMLLQGEHQETFRARMLKRIQDRPAVDWMQDFIADGGVVAARYQTTQQALVDPDIVANGHAINRGDAQVQLGPLARLQNTPAQPGPDIVEGDQMAAAWRASPRPAPQADVTDDARPLPLTGIRVVEIATIIAAPFSASFLADMGADVIKVEPIGGDPFRSLLAGIGSARVNAGKRSISVNLKSAAGRDVVLDLLRDADVLIHNFRPGVPERLGIGYAQVSAINPNIVYLQSNGYGPDGPSAARPSTHPIPGAAMGGVMYQMGERLPGDLLAFEELRLWTRRLMRANEVNPDPNTAVVITTSVLLGLVARARSQSAEGSGQQILVDMFGANAYANADDFLNYPGKRPRLMPDELLHGLGATYRLYLCAENQWVFLAIPTPSEQQQFVSSLENAKVDKGDLSLDLLAHNNADTAATLATLFLQQSALAWQELFVPAGVGCVRADNINPAEFWLSNEQAQAMNMTSAATHPAWGEYQRHGPMLRFHNVPDKLQPAPLAGQHNYSLLTELGHDQAQIDAWHEAGVLWAEPTKG